MTFPAKPRGHHRDARSGRQSMCSAAHGAPMTAWRIRECWARQPGMMAGFSADRIITERAGLFIVGTSGAQASRAPIIAVLIETIVDAAKRGRPDRRRDDSARRWGSSSTSAPTSHRSRRCRSWSPSEELYSSASLSRRLYHGLSRAHGSAIWGVPESGVLYSGAELVWPRQQRHSALSKLTPLQFEARHPPMTAA